MDTFTLKGQNIIDFPRLTYDDFVTSSSRDPYYNCIAFAAEDKMHNWWPSAYWPDGVSRALHLDSFVTVFENIGYTICTNSNLEAGFLKIALYAMPPNDEPTHAARQLPNGRWTSKIGGNNDIQHNNLECLGGGLYGEPILYMKKGV